MYHFNISPNSTCNIMNTYIIIKLCMVICYHLVKYASFVYINGRSHINKIKWYMEMQYNDIQIIIKQYGRTGIQYSYFVYFNLSECSCKYNLKAILNLDIETFTSNSDCIAFHMRALVLPKLFEYILILLLLTCSKLINVIMYITICSKQIVYCKR